MSCVQWFPIDAGLFATSGHDQTVSIWDPNSMKSVEKFHLGSDVRHFRMSYVASRHSLLAAAIERGFYFILLLLMKYNGQYYLIILVTKLINY